MIVGSPSLLENDRWIDTARADRGRPAVPGRYSSGRIATASTTENVTVPAAIVRLNTTNTSTVVSRPTRNPRNALDDVENGRHLAGTNVASLV